MPCKVLIVDDQIVPRQLFEHIIAASDRYEVAAAIDTALVADVYCARGGIDLVLMDVVMNDGSNGLDAAERIKASYPEIRRLPAEALDAYAAARGFSPEDAKRYLSHLL